MNQDIRLDTDVSSRAKVGNAGRPHFSVPGAPYRPGEEPRFAKFRQQPGDLHRPDPLADCVELAPHASGLVRVLNDEGSEAGGEWDPSLDTTTIRRALEGMLRQRTMDQRLMSMQRKGRLSFYLQSTGEEAVSIAAAMAFAPEDVLFPTYRMPGTFLVRGLPMLDLICQCIGNVRDIAKGRQMPVHYSWKAGNVVSVSSPVGTQFPQAVGVAMAAAYRGDRQVAAAWMGDGTTAQGDFHHGLNFASVYRPPVVLNVVNNQWAISTHRNVAGGGRTFANRADAYALPGIRVDGNDFLAVYSVTQWAAQRARSGGGPTLIELVTYRVAAHSTSDDPSLYRPNDEGRLWPGGDPITRLANFLMARDEWSDDEQFRITQRLQDEVAATFKQAESFGRHQGDSMTTTEAVFGDVYHEPPPHLRKQMQKWSSDREADSTRPDEATQ